ncbi:MAG: hypothetical protein AB8D52_10530 [Gammaproteobacteria bacterium]
MLKKLLITSLLVCTHFNLKAEEKIVFHLPKWEINSEEKTDQEMMASYKPLRPISSEIEDQVVIKTLVGKTDSTAQAWLEKLREDRKIECNHFSLIEIPVMGADPAPAVGQVLYCGQEKESGNGVISMHRVTEGKENLYVIERRWTTYPFDHPETAFVVREELMPWIRQMTQAFLTE